MIEPLRRDYQAMAGMVFGGVPDFDALLVNIEDLEHRLNQTHRQGIR
jgi:hypothetical protein